MFITLISWQIVENELLKDWFSLILQIQVLWGHTMVHLSPHTDSHTSRV